jgi:hypothetical protein
MVTRARTDSAEPPDDRPGARPTAAASSGLITLLCAASLLVHLLFAESVRSCCREFLRLWEKV